MRSVRRNMISVAILAILLLNSTISYAQQDKEEPVTSTTVHNSGTVTSTFKIKVTKPSSYEEVTRIDWSTELKKNQTNYKYVDLYAEPTNDAPLRLQYSIMWYERPEGANVTLGILAFEGNKSLWLDLNQTSTILKPGQHTKDLPHEDFQSAVRLTLSTALKAGQLSFDLIIYGYATTSQIEQPQNQTTNSNQTQTSSTSTSDPLGILNSFASLMINAITPWALPLGVVSSVAIVMTALALRRRKKGRLLSKKI